MLALKPNQQPLNCCVPITYTDKVGMGTDATDGVAVTDMLRDIQSSVSTEGAMEKTTYF